MEPFAFLLSLGFPKRHKLCSQKRRIVCSPEHEGLESCTCLPQLPKMY